MSADLLKAEVQCSTGQTEMAISPEVKHEVARILGSWANGNIVYAAARPEAVDTYAERNPLEYEKRCQEARENLARRALNAKD